MSQSKQKTEITQPANRRYRWIYYAVLWLAFTKLFFYAQDWFSIDPKNESRVLNNLYYACDGFFHVLVVFAAYKTGLWFSRWVIPLLLFFGFRFLILLSFVLFETEDWNLDLPFITKNFFVLCGIACLYLTIKDLIRWRQKS